MGEFRLGIQKCKKTIQDTVKDKSAFQFRGVENLFYILRKNIDQKDQSSFSATFVSAPLYVPINILGIFAALFKLGRKIIFLKVTANFLELIQVD